MICCAMARFYRLGKFCHVSRILAAAQHGAQGNHQQIVELMQSGIAGSGVLKTLPAGTNFLQGFLQARLSYADAWSRANRTGKKKTSS
jgi:hypothetical protein